MRVSAVMLKYMSEIFNKSVQISASGILKKWNKFSEYMNN